MWARLVLGEAPNTEQLQEFTRIYSSEVLPQLREEHGFVLGKLMLEEGGTTAVSLTLWETCEDCLRYHSSLSYLRFVAKTQHLLEGNFQVKLFREFAG